MIYLYQDDRAELTGDEGEAEELHPAGARAARTIAGNPAGAPMRRDRVIAALLFGSDLAVAGSRRRVIAVSDGDVTVRNGI
jgi:hypothetical protein